LAAQPDPILRPRTVRSFVLRAGRITAAQRRALTDLWPAWGVEFSPAPLDLDRVFGRRAPRVLEIGFGDGELLAELAARHPDQDFLGIEVHEPGVGHCLLLIERLGLTNVRLIRHDAVEVLRQQLPDGSIARLNLFFPDPWPKKRHHKRRIVQREFVGLISRKLQTGGLFHLATDWAPYAEHIDEVMAAAPEFESLEHDRDRPRTKFERRGERLGHEAAERLYRRLAAVPRPATAL
jgi:tRNA (guanine-N7-)-methyltransferase